MVLLLAALLAYLIVVSAIRVQLHGKRTGARQGLGRRSTISQLNNTADVSYYAKIKIGGTDCTLLVDTGSSDLWLAGQVESSAPTGFNSGVNYAVGTVNGPVKTAEVEFVGYTIPDQAFLEITPDDEYQDGDGIIGLGPNEGSNVYKSMGSVAGAAVLDRIFLQNLTTPNYLTVLLGRSGDPSDFYSGSLTIGEVMSGYEDLLQEPKLPVVDVPPPERNDQHFQILLDEDGLIGPDGRPIPILSEVATTVNRKKATVVFDTGFSLPQVPSSASEAIYSRFDGARLVYLSTIGNVWLLPCRQEVNITFKFNGQLYPIHPLDATLNPTTIGISGVVDSKGHPLCMGTPFSYDRGPNPTYDMVLGMAFLRNVYVLMDYGDFIVGPANNKDDPYLQLLSTTKSDEAHEDFVKVRLNGVDTTADHSIAKSRGPRPMVYYIITVIVAVVIFATLGFFFICRRKRRQMADEPQMRQRRRSTPKIDLDDNPLPPPYGRFPARSTRSLHRSHHPQQSLDGQVSTNLPTTLHLHHTPRRSLQSHQRHHSTRSAQPM